MDEIDLIGVRFDENGNADCRHIEVQASIRPISYISRITKEYLAPGQAKTSAKKRPPEMLTAGVKEWVHNKFRKPNKVKVIESLLPSKWSSELVVNNVRQ